ncbi:hypothetical protein Dolphis_112 [Pseudomonas phage Dolphis]|nr:hypothetical protein Dolphis_112 [Pseudomonas phage Dolphis]
MNRTIQYLNADLARAQQQGAKTLDISTADLAELIRLAERGASVSEVDKAKKRGGWVSPLAMHALITGKVNTIRVHRKRSDQWCVQMYFADNLTEKCAEVRAAQEATCQ